MNAPLSGSRRVLLFDTDAQRRLQSARHLSALDITVEDISDPATAYTMTEAEQVTAIYTVVDPSDLSTLQALARLRERPRLNQCPVIAICEAAERVNIEPMKSYLGIVEIVELPLSPESLALTLKHVPKSTATKQGAQSPSDPLTEDELRTAYSQMGKLNYFERLGIERTAGQTAIRAAYDRLSKRYQLESLTLPSNDARRLLRGLHEALSQAYSTLRNTERRTKYLQTVLDESPRRTQSRRRMTSPDAREIPWSGRPPAQNTQEKTADALRPPNTQEKTADALRPPAEAPPVSTTVPTDPPDTEMKPPEPTLDPFHEMEEFRASDTPGLVEPPVSEATETDAPAPPSSEPTPKASAWTSDFLKPPGSGSAGPSKPTPPAAQPQAHQEPAPPTTDAGLGLRPPAASNNRDEHAWGRTNIDDRSTPEMLLDAAHLQAVMGDYAGAAELVQQCLRVRPDDQSLHFKLELYKGRRAKAAGHVEIARRHFERALEVAPTKKLAASVEDDLRGVGAGSDGKKKSGGLASRLMGLSRKKK